MEDFKNIKRKKDIFSYERFILTKDMAMRAIDISDINYHGQISPWLKEGMDYSLIRDGIVTKDIKKWDRENRPLENIIKTIKEVYSTNKSKAIVLGEKLEKGKYLITISFAGSIDDADWVNNLKMQPKENFHQGFLELARNFDALASKIEFPNIKKGLYLDMIIKECTKDNSPYTLFVTGHSQGAGVAIAYIVKILRGKGVLDKNIIGITLAAPSVALAKEANESHLYPIYNIINKEDLITKLGSQIRFGIDLSFQPDEEFRDRFYINYANPLYKEGMKRAIRILEEIKDTPKAIEFAMALERIIVEKDEDIVLERERNLSINKIKAQFLFDWLDSKEITKNTFVEMTGQDLNQANVDYWYERIKEEYQRDKLKGLIEIANQAHGLNFSQYHLDGPVHTYRGIVAYRFQDVKSYYYKANNSSYEYTQIKKLWPRSIKESFKKALKI